MHKLLFMMIQAFPSSNVSNLKLKHAISLQVILMAEQKFTTNNKLNMIKGSKPFYISSVLRANKLLFSSMCQSLLIRIELFISDIVNNVNIVYCMYLLKFCKLTNFNIKINNKQNEESNVITNNPATVSYIFQTRCLPGHGQTFLTHLFKLSTFLQRLQK